MQKITPFLWFDTQAEEAANFYVSLFPNSKLGQAARYDEAGAQVSGRPAGSVMTISFTLNGQEFTALNGGPIFKFTEAVSFVVPCDTQEDIDRLWEAMTKDGGEESQCGWLKDKFGLSWQIIPSGMGSLLGGPDKAGAGRAMQAMLQMKKLDINVLKSAYEGK